MSQFITDKRVETLNYDLLSLGKELKEMTLLVKCNSTTIADLLGIIQNQNKSLTELKEEVQSLKTELDTLKKGDGVLEKLDKEEFTVESKTVEEEEIKPEDKPFRHFQFDESWRDLPEVKKWGDSKVVQSVWFNLVSKNASSDPNTIHSNNLHYQKYLIGSKLIEFENPISIKDSILTVEKFFQDPLDKSYLMLYGSLTDYAFYPKTKLTFPEFLQKNTVKGYFLNSNKIKSIELTSSSLLCVNIYS